MAKKSMIAREVKRKKLVQKYAAKRKSLLDEFKAAKDPMERLEIHRKIQGLPRNSAPNRVRNRCWATGKPRGVYRDFGLCRNQLRQRAHNGELPGVVKSSWQYKLISFFDFYFHTLKMIIKEIQINFQNNFKNFYSLSK